MIYFAFSIDFFCRWNRFENFFFRRQVRLRSKSWIVASWWHVGLLFWWQQRRRFQDADQKKDKSINRIFFFYTLSFVIINSFFWLMYRFLNRRQRSRWWVFVRHQLDHRLFQSKWKTWKRKECCCRALVEASSHLSSNSRLFNGSKSTVARFVSRTTKTR